MKYNLMLFGRSYKAGRSNCKTNIGPTEENSDLHVQVFLFL